MSQNKEYKFANLKRILQMSALFELFSILVWNKNLKK